MFFFFFFLNDTATTEIYTLPLHDALPICVIRGSVTRSRTAWFRGSGRAASSTRHASSSAPIVAGPAPKPGRPRDRKSTRLNSSHLVISYAVFCLKKKIKQTNTDHTEYSSV